MSFLRMQQTVDGHQLMYLLHIPSRVPPPETGWPLLLFLHGHGECSREKQELDVPRLRFNGPLEHVRSSRALQSMAIVTPQTWCGDNWFRSDVLMAIMEEVRASGPVRFDPDRRYVNGVSSGGAATWAIA